MKDLTCSPQADYNVLLLKKGPFDSSLFAYSMVFQALHNDPFITE